MKKEKNRFEIKAAPGLALGRIVVDTETGVNYLLCSSVSGSCALTPLFNADGSMVVTKE